MLFYGKYEHSLDSKYRLRVPFRLKEELKEQSITENENLACIAKGNDGSLTIYPMCTIKKIAEKIKDLGVPKEKRKALQVFLASIYPIDEDGQGRFTLNSSLREYAGIKKDVVFIGDCDRIVLWDKERWEAYESSCTEDVSLAEYGI